MKDKEAREQIEELKNRIFRSRGFLGYVFPDHHTLEAKIERLFDYLGIEDAYQSERHIIRKRKRHFKLN